jgi:hypothetical protein
MYSELTHWEVEDSSGAENTLELWKQVLALFLDLLKVKDEIIIYKYILYKRKSIIFHQIGKEKLD